MRWMHVLSGGAFLKIGILGGTGNMGRGLALRWALKHDIILGSRFLDKACEIAKEEESVARGFYQTEMKGSIRGTSNCDAAVESEVVVVALPPAGLIQILTEVSKCFRANQAVVSTVVSMEKRKGLFSYVRLPTEQMEQYSGKSAAEVVQEIAQPAHVVSAFQTVPAAYLSNVDSVMNIDVLVAGDDANAIAVVSSLIADISNLRPLRVGALANSALIESLTPLLLNVAILNKLQEPSIRIVPWIPICFEQ
ncbi:MAG: NADPH-dependent F420 reductase [Candidatus Bathyarchaeia archaeon]|jgi:NADPH-dependent F420 reductase